MKLGFRLFSVGTLDRWVWGEEIMLTDLKAGIQRRTGQSIWIGCRDDTCPSDVDLVVAMAPFTDNVPLTPGAMNVLWLQFPQSIMADRSCPLAAFAQHYDGIMFGSPAMMAAAGSPSNGWVQHVVVDHDRFRPLLCPRSRSIVFVGNYSLRLRSEERVRHFLEPLMSLGLEVYGSGWDKAPAPLRACWRGPLPARDTPRIYNEAHIVISVHGDEHVRYDMPNTRIFEAAACGACVVSDAVDECVRLFGDAVSWTSGGSESLEIVDRLLVQSERREAQGARAHRVVASMSTHDVLIGRLEDWWRANTAKRRATRGTA